MVYGMIWDLDIRASLLVWNRSLELNNHFSGALSYLEKLTSEKLNFIL